MALDPRLWTALEQCGVQNVHLEQLVRFFASQANGKVIWHTLRGRLDRCEMNLTYNARSYEVQRITQTVLGRDGESVQSQS